MEKVKSELQKSLAKHELLEALEESYQLQETLYDENLDRMAQLQHTIECIKDNNKSINKKMKDMADKIRELKGK